MLPDHQGLPRDENLNQIERGSYKTREMQLVPLLHPVSLRCWRRAPEIRVASAVKELPGGWGRMSPARGTEKWNHLLRSEDMGDPGVLMREQHSLEGRAGVLAVLWVVGRLGK